MAKSKEEIINWLEQHQPEQSTGWRERAEWRRANRSWIRRSQEIAVLMLDQMSKMHLTQTAVAERMGCTQQYVSKVLKGTENLSLETITKIEEALDVTLLVRPVRTFDFDAEEKAANVADDSRIDI